MHFTREPIIETVITPREGNCLVVRSSKGERDEYRVEALEVVSFNQALFFRSTERPNSFLLPVMDYEVVEAREMKAPLKVASSDRSIRIGGGRDASVRPQQREPQEEPEESLEEREHQQPQQAERFDKKRDRRRRGRRRDVQNEQSQQEGSVVEAVEPSTQVVEKETVDVAPSFISKLFPPPPTLIKETLSRYKIVEEAPSQETPVSEEMVDQEEIYPEASDEETKIED